MIARRLLNQASVAALIRGLSLSTYSSSSTAPPADNRPAVAATKPAEFKRSHYCGTLSPANEGDEVTLCGWLQSVRYSNFLLLRDVHGLVQIVLDDEFFAAHPTFSTKTLSNESVLAVRGRVRRRPAGQHNANMATGGVEVKCDELRVLNKARDTLPFTISQFNRANETARLTHRYMDLRFGDLQRNLIFRSNLVHKARHFLHSHNFVDVETPTLFRRTPGGAREFIVPTRTAGQFYCLTQSPQQFKQLLMIGGLDRYYQIARCYRDESGKADRQPEFTQVDVEMSFVDENDIMKLVEALVASCWPSGHPALELPFERIKFKDAMRLYGTDKPDLRFDMRFEEVGDVVRPSGVEKLDAGDDKAFAFKVQGPVEVKRVEEVFKRLLKRTYLPPGVSKDSFVFVGVRGQSDANRLGSFLSVEARGRLRARMNALDSDLVVLLSSPSEMKTLEVLGKLRLDVADLLDEAAGVGVRLRDPTRFKFAWVVDFPLFTRNEETSRLESSHHPFTAPVGEHLERVRQMSELDSVLGLHYDLVLNGSEVGGGSIRIHDAGLQRHVLANVLGEDAAPLEHLIKALEMGAPPHGGIALGLDRLVAILCGTANIRDVIAFPKAQSGRDLMSAAPASVPHTELDYYRIKCLEENKS